MAPEFQDDRFARLESRVDSSAPLGRLAYAAAHVVLNDNYAETHHSPEAPGAAHDIANAIDWEQTMALRQTIGATGMGIAEAMDTAQRFSLGWHGAQRLIEATGALGLSGGFCAGASTDHLAQVDSIDDLVDGVREQIQVIHNAGGVPIILPMPHLTAIDADEDTYVNVYDAIARNTPGPLLVHWLGPMFLAQLEGYFPGESFQRIMRLDPEAIRGAKISMLDADLECRLRRDLLTRNQIMLTGDDFHFGALIKGTPAVRSTTTLGGQTVALGDFSHALLGIFDAIAQPASLAMRLLHSGDNDGYDEIMARCETLGQCIFEVPTHFYKTGLAFLSWLNGHQDNAMLVNHEEDARSAEHLRRVAHLANDAGAITNAACAQRRFAEWESSLDG